MRLSQENVIHFLSLELLLNSMDQQRVLNAQREQQNDGEKAPPAARNIWIRNNFPGQMQSKR